MSKHKPQPSPKGKRKADGPPAVTTLAPVFCKKNASASSSSSSSSSKTRPRVTLASLRVAETELKVEASGSVAYVRYYSAVDHKYPKSGVTFCRTNLPSGVLLQTTAGIPLLRAYPSLITKQQADRWKVELGSAMKNNWKRYPSTARKGTQQPRYITSWTLGFGNKPTYVYSKTFQVPTSDAEDNDSVMEALQCLKTIGASGTDYVLGNLYENADCKTPIDPHKTHPHLDDSIDEHSDNEPSIDQTKSIWSVSLGQTRRFVILVPKSAAPDNATNTERMLMTIDMPHGLVLEMCPGAQAIMTHCVPKRTAEERARPDPYDGLRINLTARTLIDPYRVRISKTLDALRIPAVLITLIHEYTLLTYDEIDLLKWEMECRDRGVVLNEKTYFLARCRERASEKDDFLARCREWRRKRWISAAVAKATPETLALVSSPQSIRVPFVRYEPRRGDFYFFKWCVFLQSIGHELNRVLEKQLSILGLNASGKDWIVSRYEWKMEPFCDTTSTDDSCSIGAVCPPPFAVVDHPSGIVIRLRPKYIVISTDDYRGVDLKINPLDAEYRPNMSAMADHSHETTTEANTCGQCNSFVTHDGIQLMRLNDKSPWIQCVPEHVSAADVRNVR